MFRPATQRLTPAARRVIVRSLGNQAQSQSAGANKSSKQNNARFNQSWAAVAATLATGLSLASAVSVTFMEGRNNNKNNQNHQMELKPKPKPNVSIPPPPGVATTSTSTTTGLSQAPRVNQPPPRPDLPIYTMEQVAEHTESDSLWYTFRGGVYDLTDFYQGHPGGAPRLLMSAGQDLEPYWDVYRQHLRGHVVDWMEGYRIGSLAPDETKQARNFTFGDMYETDPPRDPNLLACTQKPFNGEPRIDLLTRDYITPNELFYVRNHLAVPVIHPKEYRLIVKGKGIQKKTFTLEELKTKFKKHEITTTLQCAGNRREDLHTEGNREFLAPHWVVGAISNAKWGGVKVRDVLKECGLDVDAMALGEVEIPGLEHIQFEAYDHDETGVHFGGSAPIEKVVDGLGDAIFAYEMNGEELPRDHGYPVRVILPGHAGCRQVKWVHKVVLSDKQSNTCWQQKSYRHFAPDVNFETSLAHWPDDLRLDQAPISQMMPVQSIICNPPQNTILGGKHTTSVTVKGVSWSGGGREIQRVDVSIDGGKTWTAAELYKPIKQKWNRHWAWTHFYKTIELPEEIQKRLRDGKHVKLDLVSKALNSDFNVQPERMEPYWNARGVAINHWYHVNVSMDPNSNGGEIRHDGSPIEFGNTPSGGKFEVPWKLHGWTADPEHDGDSGFKVKRTSVYDDNADNKKKEADQAERIRLEAKK